MQTYYIINPRRGAEIPIAKTSVGAKQCLVEPKSLTNLHLMMHLFMAHGVDHLCWRGGQLERRSTAGEWACLSGTGEVCSRYSKQISDGGLQHHVYTYGHQLEEA
jgi:hypothetical protein